MRSPFSFTGQISRPAYAAASATAFIAQHLFAITAMAGAGLELKTPWWFWLNPLRALAESGPDRPEWVLPVAMVATLIVDWLLVALAFRRTREARGNELFAAMSIVPMLQVLAIAWLSLAPRLIRAEPTPAEEDDRRMVWAAAQGLLAGMGLCVAVVAFSTLVLGVYGYGLFIVSPFVIGLACAWIGNRHASLGAGRTMGLVMGALALGGLAVMGVAFEGFICLVLASPLIAGMGALGGLLGRALARSGRRPGHASLMSFALLPALLAGEALLPPKAAFDSVESVDVAASPAAVWDAVVHMGPIADAPAAPFRWGLAYPVRGEVLGTGVGSIRRGVFSTGVAYERVTEWEPNHKLGFIVLSDPPTMHEMSPYRRVNAPHVVGYFKTLDARFTITPLSNGRARLALATRHELDLEPALYWLPLAQWAVHANKVRVLAHFRQQAEANAAPARPG